MKISTLFAIATTIMVFLTTINQHALLEGAVISLVFLILTISMYLMENKKEKGEEEDQEHEESDNRFDVHSLFSKWINKKKNN